MRKMMRTRIPLVKKNDITSECAESNLDTPLVRRAVYLAQSLDLPIRHCLPLHFDIPDIISDYKNDPDAFLNAVLKDLEVLYPKLEVSWKVEFSEQSSTGKRWWLVPNEDRDAIIVLLEHLNETAFSSPLALVEICLLFIYNKSLGKIVSELIPWFIRYGTIELITKTEIIDKLKHNFYREYIARLPPEELHEFLLSNDQSERVMAKNKFNSDLLEG